MAGPLEGIRVIEFAGRGPGPFCAMVLADLGAEVLRIARPGAPVEPRDVTTRSRAQVGVDLRAPEGAAAAMALVARADLLVEGFRPGVMERLGLGYDALAAESPKLVYCSISGYGQDGPLAQRGAFDVTMQAVSGVMARKCDPSEPLTIYATALADYAAGMHLVQGILLALIQRQRTGHGQVVEVSLYDSMLAMQMQEAAMQKHGGENGERRGKGRHHR